MEKNVQRQIAKCIEMCLVSNGDSSIKKSKIYHRYVGIGRQENKLVEDMYFLKLYFKKDI